MVCSLDLRGLIASSDELSRIGFYFLSTKYRTGARLKDRIFSSWDTETWEKLVQQFIIELITNKLGDLHTKRRNLLNSL